ncbi:MAG: hypothetical protein IT371_29610 [Deltaproteobacteria bacterium]|nr:hypothetical protein [Deltaproteobacteria bacterium]
MGRAASRGHLARRLSAVRERWARREEGSVILIFAIMLAVLIGLAAFVLDSGHLYQVRNQIQNTCDSASHAGAMKLDGTDTGITNARAAAKDLALQNPANNANVALQDADIIFGHWDTITEVFTSFGPTPTTAQVPAANAVRVLGERAATSSTPVRHFFASFLGRSQSDVRASAIAVGGGPVSECGFPLVVADCNLTNPVGSGTCQWCMQFQDANSDNAGWTTFAAHGQVGGPAINGLIRAGCYDANGNVSIDPVTRECTGGCNRYMAGQSIQVGNGNGMNTGNNNFCPTIQDILRRGNPSNVPQPFNVRVPVLQSTGACPSFQYAGTHVIAGWAVLEIYGARCSNSGPFVVAPGAGGGCVAPPSGKFIVGKLRCDLTSTGPAGGGFFGLDSTRIRLVR